MTATDSQGIAIVTCTGDRRECLAHLGRVLARRVAAMRAPASVLWVVVDDGREESRDIVEASPLPHAYVRRECRPSEPAHTLPLQLLAADAAVGSRAVVMAEDDDYLRDGWLDACRSALSRGVDLFGECHALYYNVALGAWRHMGNAGHASLAACALSRKGWQALQHRCRSAPQLPTVDLWLWREALSCGLASELRQPRPRMVSQFKAMPGRAGTLKSHAGQNYGYAADAGGAVLATLVDAEDLEWYRALTKKEAASGSSPTAARVDAGSA